MYLAYLDAGSGSMMVQAVVAGAAGAAVVGRLGWQRITAPLRKKRAEPAVDADVPVDSPAEDSGTGR